MEELLDYEDAVELDFLFEWEEREDSTDWCEWFPDVQDQPNNASDIYASSWESRDEAQVIMEEHDMLLRLGLEALQSNGP